MVSYMQKIFIKVFFIAGIKYKELSMGAKIDGLLAAALGDAMPGFGSFSSNKSVQLVDRISSASEVFPQRPELDSVVDKWRNVFKGSPQEYYNLLNRFMPEFVVYSMQTDKHECNRTVVEPVFCNGQVNFTGFPYQLTQISNHRRAFIQTFNDVLMKTPMSRDLICKYHLLLEQGCLSDIDYERGECPGCFKKEPHWCDEHGYVGSVPGDVERDIKNLLKDVNSVNTRTTNEKIALVSYFHCRLESIQPFYTANGRVGRMLMNLMLMQYDMPPVLIEDWNLMPYLGALHNFDKNGDFIGFMRWVTDAMVKSARYINM